jgi:hypothetical protein
VLESQRTVIQGDLNKGEEGISSRDQIQRRKVQLVQQGEENPVAKKSKDRFLERDLRYQRTDLVDLRYHRTDLANLRYQQADLADLRYQQTDLVQI